MRRVAVAILLLAVTGLPVATPGITDNGDGTSTAFDDFEDDTAFEAPSDEWYTHLLSGTGGGFIVDLGGSEDLVYRHDEGSGLVTRFDTGFDFCLEEQLVRIRFQINDLTLGVRQIGLGISNDAFGTGNTDQGVWLEVNTDGTTTLHGRASRGNTFNAASGSTAGPTLVEGEVYTLRILVTLCDYTGSVSLSDPVIRATFTIEELAFVKQLTASAVTNYSNGDKPVGDMIRIEGQDVDILYLEVPDYDTPPPTLASAATAAVTDLTGFEVDRTGANAIARVNGGDTVQVFSAGSLAPGATIDTDCTRFDGVAVIEQAVSFVSCDSGGTLDQFKIRDPALGDARTTACGDFCRQDIDTADMAGDQSVREIGDIVAWPFDFSTANSGGTGTAYAAMAWGFSGDAGGAAGRIGVVSFTHNNNGAEASTIDDRFLDATASPQINHICTYRDQGTGEDYIYGVTENGATKGWLVSGTVRRDTPPKDGDVTYSPSAGYIGTEAYLDITMSSSPVFTGGTSLSNARGIACATGLIAVQTPTHLRVVDTGSGSELWNEAVSTPRFKGVAMSDNGLFVTWVDGSEGFVAHASNGTKVARYDTPSGTFHSVHMDEIAQSVWVATYDNIARYEASDETTGGPISITNPGGITVGGGDAEGEDADLAPYLVDLTPIAIALDMPTNVLNGLIILAVAVAIALPLGIAAGGPGIVIGAFVPVLGGYLLRWVPDFILGLMALVCGAILVYWWRTGD